jgi:alpha-ribazole phosphatase
MRLIVVRHYKTTSNESGNIIGWSDAPPVREWREDINYVNDVLAGLKLKINRIYTSKLRRARNTGLFYANSQKIHKVYHAAELNEVNYGKMSKKSKSWVAQNVPEHKKDPDYCYPDGESFSQMQKRSVDYVLELARKYPDKVIMIVVHAGIIRGLLCHFLGLDYAPNLDQHLGHRYIGIFDFDGEKCTRYEEVGKKSGFIRHGVVKTPHQN